MSNGARHALGVVAGLLLPPLIAAALWYGVGEFIVQAREFRISWVAVGAIVAAGVVLAFVAGSRLSPVASLLGGLLLTAVGVLPLVELTGTRLIPDNPLPPVLLEGYMTLAYSGTQLFVGVALLVASVFPARWRGRPEPVYSASYAPAPMPYQQHDSGPEDATRPMFRD
jgi:hypothetical protein